MERTIGSLKTFVPTYATETEHGNLKVTLERALTALMFSPNATLKILPFRDYYGREANTVLRNFTQNPLLKSLKGIVLRHKSDCLDSEDPCTDRMPPPALTNWNDCSDVEYDVEHINHPRELTEAHS